MKKYKAYSPAKINLTLEIIEKMPNGFHALRSVVIKTKKLRDELEIIIDENNEGIEITCTDKNIPTDEKNICYKIAQSFFEALGRKAGIVIRIKKNIPAMAGLGGGSSNGAVVLRVLNKHFKNIFEINKLIEIASSVGKDIPLFLFKEKVIMMTGAGEKIKPAKNNLKLNMLLINPQGEISTAWAYQKLDKELWFMEDKNRVNVSQKMLKNLENSDKIGSLLYNDFNLVAEEAFPIIRELRSFLLAFGASGVSITGKGPTVFALFGDKNKAFIARKIIKNRYPSFFVELG